MHSIIWESQIDKIHLFKKKVIRNVNKSAYNAHTKPLHKEQIILKVHDLYRLSILKFYSKLVNNKLPRYFNNFTPQFSLSHIHNNIRNPRRHITRGIYPCVKHKLKHKDVHVFCDEQI